MVRHKSRLEREKDAAAAEKKPSPEASQGRQRSASAASSFAGQVNVVSRRCSFILAPVLCSNQACMGACCDSGCQFELPHTCFVPSHGLRQAHDVTCMRQGLGDMKKHMSRLEKDRADVVAKRAVGVSSPAVQSRVPSYMRQTAASAAMQRVSIAAACLCCCASHNSTISLMRSQRQSETILPTNWLRTALPCRVIESPVSRPLCP